MKITSFIICLSLVFISSCKDPAISLMNCQDTSNDCFMEGPEEVELSSYSPSVIKLVVIPPDELDDPDYIAPEEIEIERFLNNTIDTTYKLTQDDELGVFFDSINLVRVRYGSTLEPKSSSFVNIVPVIPHINQLLLFNILN